MRRFSRLQRKASDLDRLNKIILDNLDITVTLFTMSGETLYAKPVSLMYRTDGSIDITFNNGLTLNSSEISTIQSDDDAYVNTNDLATQYINNELY